MKTELEVALGISPALEKNWDRFSRSYSNAPKSPEGTQLIAGHILGKRKFINDTLSAKNPNYQEGEVSAVDALMIQQGHKFIVYRVEAGDYQFAFILSGGRSTLNIELQDDYKNLGDLRRFLEKKRLPIFVPKPYAISDYGGISNGIAAFSVEFLAKHAEVNVRRAPKLWDMGIQLSEFYLNSPLESAIRFNQQQEVSREKVVENLINGARGVRRIIITPHHILFNSDYYQTNQMMKKGMIERLYISYLLNGSVPRHFSVNFGDTMADPQEPDFDFKIISISGGWGRRVNEKGLASESIFKAWLFHQKEYPLLGNEPPESLPLFNEKLDGQAITEGIKRGRQRLSRWF